MGKKTEKLSREKQNYRELDEKDRKILNLLAENSRQTLKSMSREVSLSIDAVKARMDKMKEAGIIRKFTIQIGLSKIGFGLTSHVYIKLHNITDEALDDFNKAMMINPRIIVFMSMLGDYDAYLVINAKDAKEMTVLKNEVKKKFATLIADWKEVIVSEIFKLEEYRI